MKRTGSSATQEAYERLRADVLSSRLRPGSRLKIADLCSSLDVSLGAVREALSRLTSEGLVVSEPQRGFRVAPISAFELRDLTSLRVDIESMCLRRSIQNGDVAWEANLVAAYHTLSRIPERTPQDPALLNQAWAAAHRAFHEALVAACDSPSRMRVREMLYAQSERYRQLSAPLSEFNRDVDGEHKQIMDATLARNADLATALLASHFMTTTAILLEKGSIKFDADEMAEAG